MSKKQNYARQRARERQRKQRLQTIGWGVGVFVVIVGVIYLVAQADSASPAGTSGNSGALAAGVPTLAPNVVAQGEVLYNEYCAECHGVELEGQPNWQQPDTNGIYPAPPHDVSGHTWHHADQQLIQIILQGTLASGGTMPGFSEVMSIADAEAVLGYIKSYWGAEEREFQWGISNQ